MGVEHEMTETSRQNPAKPSHLVLSIFVIALWFGLAGGLLEGLSFLIAQEVEDLKWSSKVIPVDLNILWASPLMDVLLFLLIAGALLPVFALFRWRGCQKVATAVFATLVFYAVLSAPARLRERGAVALALGLGVVVSRWAERNPQRSMNFFHRTLPILVIGAFLAGVGVVGVDIGREKWQQSRLPASPPGAPNVLLIVLDTLRADRLGAYGYARPTSPYLDAFARQGVRFDLAFATSSWTLPSHASMFTGRFPHEHKAMIGPLDHRYPTLAEVFAENGYATLGISSNNGPTSRAFGLPRGFLRWESIFFNALDSARRTLYGRKIRKNVLGRVRNEMNVERIPAPEIIRRFLRWVDRRPQRPFFAYLNFMEMHLPYQPPYEFAARFSPEPDKISPPHRSLFAWQDRRAGVARVKYLSDAYDAALAYLDTQLKLLFDELRRRGLEENLLVIITSDHGESLGEHGLYLHGMSLYREQTQVPLLIRDSRKVPSGLTVSLPVSLQALPATIMDLAGLNKKRFPPPSLVPLWSGETQTRPPVISEVDGTPFPGVPRNWPTFAGWIKSMVTPQWYFICYESGKTELYSLRDDPQQLRNLAGDPEQQRVVAALRAQLQGLIAGQSSSLGSSHTGGPVR